MFYIVHSMTVTTSRKPHLKCVKKPILSKVLFLRVIHMSRQSVLFDSHCLSLYGGALWDITCGQLTSLEVAFNNILRQIWRLPRNCHTWILHKIAHLDSVFNRLVRLSDRFSRKTCESNSYLLQESFTLFNNNVFTPVGSNRYCAHKYVKLYFEEDHICADFARHLHINNSSIRDLDIESMIQIICCNYLTSSITAPQQPLQPLYNFYNLYNL